MVRLFRAVTIFISICYICAINIVSAQAIQNQETIVKPEEIAGEIFGVPVSMGNYYFAKRALMVFGAKWGNDPTTPKELEDMVWLNLILSYESYKRNIDVSQEEVDDEVSKNLKGEKASFDWKKDKEAFEKWIQERAKESSDIYVNQLRYLLQIQKLRQQILDSIVPAVTEEEAYEEYCNEYNTLELELAQFDDLNSASEFYKKAKASSRFWDKQVKDNPKIFRRPGFVALEFLMDMWKLPKDDLYKILELKENAIYPVIPIYSGKYAAVRLIKVRKAEKEEFSKLRQSYLDQVKMKKKYDGLAEWLKKIKDQANIRVYIKG